VDTNFNLWKELSFHKRILSLHIGIAKASLPPQLKAGKEYNVNYMTLDFVSKFDF
jgi:hypothetical protein